MSPPVKVAILETICVCLHFNPEDTLKWFLTKTKVFDSIIKEIITCT